MPVFHPDRSNSAAVQLQKVGKPWHEALAEYFILYPNHSLGEVAKHFEVSLPWLSLVKNSDAFQEYYQARRREHFDDVSQSLAEAKVREKLGTLAELSVDAMTDKVEAHIDGTNPMAELSLDALGNVASIALKSLGFGQKQVAPSGTGVSVNNTYIFNGDVQALNEARTRLRDARVNQIDPTVLNNSEVLDGESSPPRQGAIPSAA